jgi:hypothetical protein
MRKKRNVRIGLATATLGVLAILAPGAAHATPKRTIPPVCIRHSIPKVPNAQIQLGYCP